MIYKKAYAKINLSLDVLSKRQDGYHNISTIMVKTDLYDELFFDKNSKDTEIYGDFGFNKEKNIIYKAYQAISLYIGKNLPIKVKVKKNIPMQAGLAGGTADGAATLQAINEIYSLNLTLKDLMKISEPLGADFPFMLNNKNMKASGIGNILSPCGSFLYPNVLIVNPGYGVSTPIVYNNLKLDEKRIKTDEIIRALNAYDYKFLSVNLANKMEKFVFTEHKDLCYIKEKLRTFNGISLMSGSGPTIFAIFERNKDLERAYKFYRNIYKNVFKVRAGDFYGNIWLKCRYN